MEKDNITVNSPTSQRLTRLVSDYCGIPAHTIKDWVATNDGGDTVELTFELDMDMPIDHFSALVQKATEEVKDSQ